MLGFPQNILIVDDDELVLETIAASLEYNSEALNIQSCTSSEEALQIIQKFTPDLILLDLRMPGKDGTSFLESFKNHKDIRRTFIIFVTGANVPMQEEYQSLNVIGTILKPFTPKTLLRDIQRIWVETPDSVKDLINSQAEPDNKNTPN